VAVTNVGLALASMPLALNSAAALVRRGQNDFVEKIRHVAEAGGRFLVMYNNEGTSSRHYIQGADVHFLPIPTVFIDQSAGTTLSTYLDANPSAQAEVALDAAVYTLPITKALQCEHVTLRVRTTHPRRADLRITLVSPAGTRSVLQQFNGDLATALDDWTYSSVQFFYESSVGNWGVEISDERAGVVGHVTALDLTVTGVSINDEDADGLPDPWELAHFGSLATASADDPDRDGASNLREHLLDTDPLVAAPALSLDITAWDTRYWRLSWPTTPYAQYRLEAAASPEGPYALILVIESDFTEAEWLVPAETGVPRFFRVGAFGRH
jgi:subtilisin-like proprotein convertase family protein